MDTDAFQYLQNKFLIKFVEHIMLVSLALPRLVSIISNQKYTSHDCLIDLLTDSYTKQ